MAPALIIVALFAVLLLLGAGIAVTSGKREMADRQQVMSDDSDDTLRFRVVPGQDPAAAIAALAGAGYDVFPQPGDDLVVVVLCPDGREAAREEVRSLIAQAVNVDPQADPDTLVPVRFADE